MYEVSSYRFQLQNSMEETYCLINIGENKAETRTINHDQPQSHINERLTLDFNMQLDTRTGKYLEKHVKLITMQIDFLPTIITEAGIRSGGVGRIDLSEPLNRNYQNIFRS
jgi:hypothetical protein